MKTKEEFYIGWQENAPKSFAKQSKGFILILFFVVLVFACIIALNQKKVVNSTYEAPKIQQIKGVLCKYPVPMLRVAGVGNTFQNYILVGFGKSDANQTIQKIEKEVGNLENHTVTLTGSLIYYDGKGVIEVPFDKNQNVATEQIKKSLPERKIQQLGKIDLKGEIVDPKCFFGVMKPGFGKVHRSCAVRCIAGGIPPMLVIQNKNKEAQYFILISEDGKPINKEIQDFVGKPIQLKGNLEKVEDWFVIRLNPQKDIQFNRNSKAVSWYEE